VILMVSTNWTNKWVLMMMAGIVTQAVVYPYVWFTQIFEHEFFLEVFLIGIVSVIVQVIGFGTIMSKTRDADPVIYGQGRPFQHKLREEDEDVATRKPTFDDAE